MHEAAFSQAALPAPARVLGLNLRPFSLGHELWLIREQNPLALHSDGASLGRLIEALPQAVMFCAQKFSEIKGMNTDWSMPFKLRLWNVRLRKFHGPSELSKFMEYRTLGTLSFPDDPPPCGRQGRPFGTPLILSLHEYLRKTGVPEDAAWDYPYGLAQMRFAAHLESEGKLRVKNLYEMEHDRAFAEWEKENNVSTLIPEDANA